MLKTYLSKIKTSWKYTEKPYKWEWTLLAVICTLFLPTFFYNDIIATSRHGINLWHCLADGESILNFFTYNAKIENVKTYAHIENQSAAYSFVVYLVFAIWNLPLFFLERFAKIDIFANSLIVFYTKSLLVLALLYSGKILKQICGQLKWSKSKSSWVEFIYLSSTLVMSCIVIEGQYDIFSVCLTLLAIRSYLKDDKLGFIGWFSLAFTFKLFAFIIFIPLLLFKEKKITKILSSTIISIVPLVLIKLIFKIGETTHTGSIVLERNLFSSWFSAANFAIAGYDVYFFIVAMTLLCIYCYYKDIKDKDLFLQYTIYISFLSYCIFFLLIPAHPYWFILIAPYLTLIIFSNSEKFKLNLLLETIGLASLFLFQQIKYFWCFSPAYFIQTFVGKRFSVNNPTPIDFFNPSKQLGKFKPKFTNEIVDYIGNKIGLINFAGMLGMFLGSIFIATIIALIIINNPSKIEKTNSSSKSLFFDDVVIERSVVYTRIIITLIVSSIPIIVFLLNYYKGYLN